MGNSGLLTLYLGSPLVFARAAAVLPDDLEKYDGTSGELLFCFQLEAAQCRSIEPRRERLLKDLIFAGKKPGETGGAETVSMPAGEYLFVQRRRALGKDEWLDMAVEQQKDGLWERNKLSDTLFLRYLFEDASPVTQLFRPFRVDAL